MIVLNAGCPAIFARLETWVFIGLAGAGSLVTLYVAADATPLLRPLVQPATGVIAGMFLQPSTSGLVALVTAAMILTSATPARC